MKFPWIHIGDAKVFQGADTGSAEPVIVSENV